VEATAVSSLMLLIQLEHSDIRCHRLEEATDQSLMFEVDQNHKLEVQVSHALPTCS
jgi:hypothetical protein